jgi:integrase/recombinase XerD
MRADRQMRHYSPHTIDGSLRYVAQFAKPFHTSPDRLDAEHIRTYQLHLLQQQVSKRICIPTVCALRFCYETTLGRPGMADSIPYPQKPQTLPVIRSRDAVKALRLAPRHLQQRAILATLYATGVRVSALCHLPGTASDSQRMVIRIRQGKGQRDRCVLLSPALLPLRRRYWQLSQLQSWLCPGYRVPEPSTRRGVAHLCRPAGRMAKLTKTMYPHWLRHNLESL